MVGIIILNYNSAEDIIKCVSSIKKFTEISYRIYIVDGASTDNSYNELIEWFDKDENIKIIKSEINGGYSYGNNIGIKAALEEGAQNILIINPDVVILNSAIDIMYSNLINNPEIAVVGPRIYDTKNCDMQFASKLYTFRTFLWSKKPLAYLFRNKINTKRYYEYNRDKDFQFQGMVSGCCFMIKSNILKSINLFDENVFLFYEEDILAYKLLENKKYTKITSTAVVLHNHSTSTSKEGAAFIRYHRFISSQYVLKKYAKVSQLQLLIVSIMHLIPFITNAIYKKSYRIKFRKFLLNSFSLMVHYSK